MPLTIRQVARVAVLVIGFAAAALLGLVAVSHGDAASARPGTPVQQTSWVR